MAALAVFQTRAFTSGAELAAIIFSAFGYAGAGINFAIATRMSTGFFSHGYYLLVNIEGSYHATASGDGSVPSVSRFLEEQRDFDAAGCLCFSTERSQLLTVKFLLHSSTRVLRSNRHGRSANSQLQTLFP